MTPTIHRPTVQHLAVQHLAGPRPAVRGRGYAAPVSPASALEP